MKDNNTGGGGIGFCGLLTIAFIVLKLAGYITWSWWWVVAPIWISSVLVAILLLACWWKDKSVEREIWKNFKK